MLSPLLYKWGGKGLGSSVCILWVSGCFHGRCWWQGCRFHNKGSHTENKGPKTEDEVHLKKCVKSTIVKGLAELMRSTSNYWDQGGRLWSTGDGENPDGLRGEECRVTGTRETSGVRKQDKETLVSNAHTQMPGGKQDGLELHLQLQHYINIAVCEETAWACKAHLWDLQKTGWKTVFQGQRINH